jgi:hypothetical protein
MDQSELHREAIYCPDMSLLNITKINLSLKVFSYFHSGFPDFSLYIINVVLFYGLAACDRKSFDVKVSIWLLCKIYILLCTFFDLPIVSTLMGR